MTLTAPPGSVVTLVGGGAPEARSRDLLSVDWLSRVERRARVRDRRGEGRQRESVLLIFVIELF